MKKRMRFAAMLAGAVLLCDAVPAVPVSAAETTAVIPLYCWGTTDGSKFQDMTLLDDKGMFKWVGYGGVPGTPRDYQVYTQHYAHDVEAEVTYSDTGETKIETTYYEGDNLYVVMPRSNILRMVFRADLDETETRQKAVTILRKYYPEMLVGANSTGFPASFYQYAPNTYELCDLAEDRDHIVKRDIAVCIHICILLALICDDGLAVLCAESRKENRIVDINLAVKRHIAGYCESVLTKCVLNCFQVPDSRTDSSSFVNICCECKLLGKAQFMIRSNHIGAPCFDDAFW